MPIEESPGRDISSCLLRSDLQEVQRVVWVPQTLCRGLLVHLLFTLLLNPQSSQECVEKPKVQGTLREEFSESHLLPARQRPAGHPNPPSGPMRAPTIFWQWSRPRLCVKMLETFFTVPLSENEQKWSARRPCDGIPCPSQFNLSTQPELSKLLATPPSSGHASAAHRETGQLTRETFHTERDQPGSSCAAEWEVETQGPADPEAEV